MSGVVQRVDESIESTPEDEYKSLLRSLSRRKGFGLAFVRCSPAGGMELIKKVRDDLSQKQIGVLELKEPIDNLIELVQDFPNQENLNILFVVGLEKSLEKYIRSGYGGEGDYYNLDQIPPILNHLNWQRENFRDKLRHICFVFLLSPFAIKYIVRRSPDFFDWGSGVINFLTSKELAEQKLQRIKPEENSQTFLNWTSQQRAQRIIEIKRLLAEQNQNKNRIIALLFELGDIFFSSEQYENAISSYDKVLEINSHGDYKVNSSISSGAIIGATIGSLFGGYGFIGALLGSALAYSILGKNSKSYLSLKELASNKNKAWYSRGNALFDLGRYEEAISSYDKAIEIDPDSQSIWLNRSVAIRNLGRYTEAIISCEKALDINPDSLELWHEKGYCFEKLGQYEESLQCHNQTVRIKSDYAEGWYNRGVQLGNLGRYEEAIQSYDKALEIDSDYYKAWNNRGGTLANLGKYEEAIQSYDKALEIKPDYHEVLNNRGVALGNIGKYEEAILSYDTIKLDYYEALINRGVALSNLGRYEEALSSYDKALEIKSSDPSAYYNKACAYSLQNNLEPALENLQKATQLNPEKYRDMAKTDSDFDNIRHDPRFQALIQ
jgi:tetratricopeptide (TPR) repeat protein